MNSIKHICFDLDGTLVDSNETILKSTIKALDQLGIKHNFDEELFRGKIGQHFVDIFNDFGVDVPDFDGFLKVYKSIYFDFIDDSTLYPKVEETLSELKKMNHKISLLTTKAQDQADLIIDYFNLRTYFDHVMGRRSGVEHKPSPEPLLMICDTLNVLPENSLMVGDTELDILCGKNANSSTCALTHGYRTNEQLMKHDPDFIIDEIFDVIGVVNKGN